MNLAVLLLVSASTTAGSSQPAVAQDPRAGVEVYIRGSDIESSASTATQALRDGLEALISSRANLKLALPGGGNFTILIPELVRVDERSEKITFSAHVIRKRDGASTDVSGSCKRSAIIDCTRKIIAALGKLGR